MKKILFMVIGFMFAVQTAFASPTGDKMNLETLNKSDAQVLFQDDMMNQQVVLLDEGQMNELKAKGWWGRHVIKHTHRWRVSIQRGLGKISDKIDHIFGIKSRAYNPGEQAENFKQPNNYPQSNRYPPQRSRGFNVVRFKSYKK